MTNQVPDIVYIGDEYYIQCNYGYVQVFKPETFGLEARQCSTALYRGFYCEYEIIEDQLFLKNFTICSKDRQYPEINDIEAQLNRHMHTYFDLYIPYTGDCNLLVGQGGIVGLGIDPLTFNILKGLHFRNGKLVSIVDYSKTSIWLKRWLFLRKIIFRMSYEEVELYAAQYIPFLDYRYERFLEHCRENIDKQKKSKHSSSS